MFHSIYWAISTMIQPEPPREFNCEDCGIHVVQIVVTHSNDQNLCAECTWLRSIDDPVERATLREFLRRRYEPKQNDGE